MTETASVRRYRGHDEYLFGIQDGMLVAVIDADADADYERYTVCFTLPDLRDPQCVAYLSDVGPELATIEVQERGGEPWGMVPVDPDDVPRIVAAAEVAEARAAAVLADPSMRAVFRDLADAGVAAEQLAEAYAEVTSQ
jgi:hypothetical protein